MKALYDFLTSKGQMLALFLAILCIAIVMISIFTDISGQGYDVGTDLVSILKDPDSTQEFNFFNAAIYIPQALIIVTALAMVVFGVIALISDPKGSMKFFVSGVIILVLFFLFYSMSESETTGKIFSLLQKNNIGDGTSKFISGGIKTSILMIGFSVVAAIAGEVYNFFI